MKPPMVLPETTDGIDPGSPTTRLAMSAKARTLLIYLIGGLMYIFLCGPAIEQRGYPPIDPVWTGATYLWVTPILICSLIAASFKEHWKLLCIYCLITAFFDAASDVIVVPKFIDPVFTLLSTIF